MFVFTFFFYFAFHILSFGFAQNIKSLENGQEEGMEKYKRWLEKQKENVSEEKEKKDIFPKKETGQSRTDVFPVPTISMDFQDANMKDILKIFSQQSGLNFIAGEKIRDSKITLYLDKVSVEDALNTILKGNNLTYEQAEGSNIFIVKELTQPEIETITRVFTLNYALSKSGEDSDSEDIKEVVENVLSEHGKVITYERTNSLIVTDIPSNFERIEKTINKLDTPIPQVMIEAEILETAVGLLDKLGVDWASGNAPGISITYSGPSETTLSNINTSTLSTAIINASATQAVLKALSTNTKTRWLAKPKICVLNNEEATIDIVTDAAVGVITTIDDEGNRTESIERMDIGTKLKVIPHVNKSGEITLEIEPEVSRAAASAKAVSGAVDKLKRTAKTKVIVKDGNTIIIGGLISTEKGNIFHRIPFFSEIPFMGNLFRYQEDSDKQTELVIFITPHIVKYWESSPKSDLSLKDDSLKDKEEYPELGEEILQLEPIIVN